MKFIMDGHEYSYNDLNRELKNNYGTVVAEMEYDFTDEYYYPLITELGNNEQPPPIHVNVIKDTARARGMWLTQTYVASTY